VDANARQESQREEREAVRRAEEEGHVEGARGQDRELARIIEPWRQAIRFGLELPFQFASGRDHRPEEGSRTEGREEEPLTEIGYTLSSEEQGPNGLVRYARLAEECGFEFALISDHFHPWIDRQGQSPFVWSVIGAIAHETERLRVGTGVTCPTVRIHPAIVAQAAATAATMMPGRFFLGVGSGENLNEHIVGRHWPPVAVRQEMLEEAVRVIRHLWEGGVRSFHGRYFTVENARIYTLPEEPPPIMVAAAGAGSGELAGRIGDGLIGVAPDPELIEAFESAGGSGKPRYGQLHVCWAKSEEEGRRIALEWWPNTVVKGEMSLELPLPQHFEQAAELVTEEQIGAAVTCGPDPEKHHEAIAKYVEAGYDHVYVHQIGPDQEGFFDFYGESVLPHVRDAMPA
jgi:coenzyme F420-dependent glucose-6-phosphate dehydrogenase